MATAPAPVRRAAPLPVVLSVLGSAAYLAFVYLVNAAYPTTVAPVWQAELWNYGTAALAMVLIHVCTRGVQRPRPALPAGTPSLGWLLTILGVGLVLVALFWMATTSAPIRWLIATIYRLGAQFGLPHGVLSVLVNVLAGGLWITAVLTGLSVWRVRQGGGAIGFRFGRIDWLLGLALILFAIAAAYVEDHLYFGGTQPAGRYLPQTLWAIPSFLLMTLVNGLQEETLFRGYVLPQLLAFLRRPWLAMLLMITIFDLFHLPSDVIGHQIAWGPATLTLLFPLQPTGLLFGYTYWRSRSLVPGILLHTYTTLWAFFFL